MGHVGEHPARSVETFAAVLREREQHCEAKPVCYAPVTEQHIMQGRCPTCGNDPKPVRYGHP